MQFDKWFEALTGNSPLSWQRRLYEKHFAGSDAAKLPNVIDLPTGLGKTMVMAIWLIARAEHKNKMPTRLIYVVDRRTVVDQASDLAITLRDNCKQALQLDPPAISTLRGQLADNREWSRDPSRSAIIIGTVDLIGSALLFSGYRSGFKSKPLHAGLLGQDSLLVLDEAHLSRPFEKLLDGIGKFQIDRDGNPRGKPLRIIRMTATSAGDEPGRFTLEEPDLCDTIVQARFTANKCLSITTSENDKLTDKLAKGAIKLAQDNKLRGKRIVVFVRRPDDAKSVAQAIRESVIESVDESGLKPKKVRNAPYADSVAVLTGTMRGLERDELIEWPVLKRFLDGDEKPGAKDDKPVFLISTSAGEVGFDLNADHMVCDATTIDSFIQRLGRVNRRGDGDATVILITDSKPADTTEFDKACIAATKLITDLLDGKCVSPKALSAFKQSLTTAQIDEASTPKPTPVELTDILLDNWSMTSVTAPMPGRPAVGPWLRGIDDELPQTTIAWRAELDEPGFADLDFDDIEEWFDTHRILTHETLSVPTNVAAKWFTDRWDNLDDKLKSDVGGRPIIVDHSGLKLVTVKEVIAQLARKNTDSIRYADIIIPASFGGIERSVGLLDAAAPKQPEKLADADEHTGQAEAKARRIAPDVADVRGRYREIVVKSQDGETESIPLDPSATMPAKSARHALTLESDDDRTIRLVSYVPRSEKLETGSEPQTLKQHVVAVRKCLDGILSRVLISDDFKLAAQLASEWHDHGKNREFFQRAVGGTRTGTVEEWHSQTKLEGNGAHQCRGKSGGIDRGRPPRGYRHEFGSLCEFTDAFNAGTLLDGTGKPISEKVFDLAMHLIAAHHGRGRPHFPKGGFDPDCESRSDEIHTNSIRRFARLQRKYGWWYLAWLENLLRCADAMASAQIGSDTDADETENEA